LTAEVQAHRLDGFLAVSGATLEAGIVEYRGRNVASIRDMALLEDGVRQALLVERLTRRGIDPALVQEAQARIDFRTSRVTRRGATGETGAATFALAYVVGFVLYMAIILYSVNVMRSVLEEKQTRIVEVLVSSMRPFQLMLGKVIGVGSVGLLQFGIWAAAAYAMIHYRGALFSLFGASAAAGRVQFPAVGAAMLLVSIGYFLFGYLLYSAMFAVVGASVNTDSEAQQAQLPVMMLLIASIIMFPAILNEPGGRLSVSMSLIPFSAPIIMPIRFAAAEVPARELAASFAILAATTVAVVWLSARIYRVGILMYGKRPNLRELVRWVRQS
jgi:ABC-2 type transport system permease protein